MLQKGKTPLKSNKKRRIGTNNCILFCVLIWRSILLASCTAFRGRALRFVLRCKTLAEQSSLAHLQARVQMWLRLIFGDSIRAADYAA